MLGFQGHRKSMAKAITLCRKADVDASVPVACRLAPVGLGLACDFIQELCVCCTRRYFLDEIWFSGLPSRVLLPQNAAILHENSSFPVGIHMRKFPCSFLCIDAEIPKYGFFQEVQCFIMLRMSRPILRSHLISHKP